VPKIALVTDTISCLPPELIAQHNIEIVPITILVGGKVYRDWVDMDPDKAYQLFLQDPDSFKAAPATPEECYQVLARVSQKAEEVVCICASGQISTLVNVLRTAAEKLCGDQPGTRVEIIDSETATAAEGFVALAAAAAIEADKPLAVVLEAARKVKAKVKVVALLDTVKYVYRSGRVPRIAAQVGSILQIKPIFTIEGTVHFTTAVVSRRKGIERMLKMMKDKVGKKPIHCAVMHAYDLQEAQELKALVAAQFNCVELWVSEFSPVMGYATGTGALGLAFYAD
jgi:DegV family protein with EDD domain